MEEYEDIDYEDLGEEIEMNSMAGSGFYTPAGFGFGSEFPVNPYEFLAPEPADPWESIQNRFAAPTSGFNSGYEPTAMGPGGSFTQAPYTPSPEPTTTAPSGYRVGTDPQKTAAQYLAEALANESQRTNMAKEALEREKLALARELQQAQLAALRGDPTAERKAAEIQNRLAGIDAETAALEREKLAAEQAYREGLLESEAAKLGLSREELQANLALSREKLAVQIDQFNKQYGLDWMKNAQAVEQFNAQLGFDYWQSGNQLLFNTWSAQMQQATTMRGQDLNYALGNRQVDASMRGDDLNYNLGAGRLNLDTQGQMFDQAMELSNLAANPRNLAQSLIMLGMSPSGARDFMASTPLVSTWLNHSTDLDRMPYQSAVPFEYGDNDLPLSFLPAGNDMRGYGFMPPSMMMPMQPINNLGPAAPPPPMPNIPMPNFGQPPSGPYATVPPMSPSGMTSPAESTPTQAPEHGTTSNTAPPMTTDTPAAVTVPSFADWAKTSGYSYKDGSYKPRSPTGSSVIPNRGLDPYYGSSTRKQGK